MNPYWRRLDLARYRLGWSYADLGRYMGVSNSTAYYWCKGTTLMPQYVRQQIPYLEAAADQFEAQVQRQQQAQQQQQQLQTLAKQLLTLGAVGGIAWLVAKVLSDDDINDLLNKTHEGEE